MDLRNEIPLSEWERPVNNQPGPGGTLNRRVSHSDSRQDSPVQSVFERDIEDGIPATYSNGITPSAGKVNTEQLQFRARHIQMMALGKTASVPLQGLSVGSAMASSLLVNSAKGLYHGGPVSLLMAYILMGSVAWAMLVLSRSQLINRVDFAGRNGFLVTCSRRLHHPRQPLSVSLCGKGPRTRKSKTIPA
jgi:hypothetical protein